MGEKTPPVDFINIDPFYGLQQYTNIHTQTDVFVVFQSFESKAIKVFETLSVSNYVLKIISCTPWLIDRKILDRWMDSK